MGNFATQPEFATVATSITPSDTIDSTKFLDGAALYVGVGGDVAVIMNNIEGLLANRVVFKNVPDGTFLPAIVDYVVSTDTTASDILSVK